LLIEAVIAIADYFNLRNVGFDQNANSILMKRLNSAAR